MAQQRKTKGIADNIDKHVGKQLKARRTLLGISQEKLADAVGVTFQQVQKYERGANRVSASRLFSFSKILEVNIDYFYSGIETQPQKAAVKGMSDNDQEEFDSEVRKKSSKLPQDIMSSRETINLVKAYYAIEDESARKDILKFIKSMTKKIN